MSEVKLNLQQYKASGVYFEEIDNSISTGTSNAALRIAIGYNERGPFNRPIYLSTTADCDDIIGGIDRKLERRGCYTNRNIRTMVKTAPVYALNLLNVDSSDNSGFCALSVDAGTKNNLDFAKSSSTNPQYLNDASLNMPFADMFDRSKFWISDSSVMMKSICNAVSATDTIHGPLYGLGNCGTRDISVIVRKAEGLTGYNVTFLDWYGSEEAIPYKWINPYDYVADYFIEVIAVVGNYSDTTLFAKDSVWSTYFDASGLKKDKVNKFMRLDAVTVLGDWIGCIIPDFYDKQGKCKSINYLINRTCDKTGLMFGINTSALDFLAYANGKDGAVGTYYLDLDGDGNKSEEATNNAEETKYGVDMNGMNISIPSDADGKSDSSVNFMSYDFAGKVVYELKAEFAPNATNSYNEFIINAFASVDVTDETGKHDANANDYIPVVGDYVRAKDGRLTRIIKKRVQYIEVKAEDSTKDPSKGTETSTNIDTQSDEGTTKQDVVTPEGPGETKPTKSYYQYTYTTLAPVHKGSVKGVKSFYAVKDDGTIQNDETIPEGQGYQNYMVYGADESTPSKNDPGSVEIHRNIMSLYTNLKFIQLKGLKLSNKHRPGFDKSGKIDVEAGVEKIYSMLEDTGIRRGLLNNETIDFRYIVDTLSGGLGTECGGKKHLAKLAEDKGHCTALINMPSMSDFANSTSPYFCEFDNNGVAKTFDTKYIPEGGNQDYAYKGQYEDFTLPTEDNGAKYAAVFAPYFKYAEGTKTILVPPAADVCNTFMKKYLGGDPYKTVANLNGIISNSSITGLEYDLDKTDRGYLEPFGVNSIISNGGLLTIFGDRTCYQTINSDFNFLHVRELLNTIEIRCKAILKDYVYTYNNAVTRAEIDNRIRPILNAMQDSGALAKFELQIDDINNTQEVIDEKFCIVDIAIWVTPNMEKIVTRITVNRGSEA